MGATGSAAGDGSKLRRMVDATPASRERYIDFLRVFSLVVVIVGHWTMAAVTVTSSGTVRVANILAINPQVQPVTWIFQVMPVFFIVGGFSHAVGIASLRSRGGGYSDFVRIRAIRLLGPTAVFMAVWVVISLGIELAGQDHGIPRSAARTAAQPLWFIGVYLGIVAMAPLMWDLHQHLGRAAAAVPVGLGVAAAAVDLARIGFDWSPAGYLNVALVWLAIHQFGFFYQDGSLLRAGQAVAWALALAGLGATVALTTVGPYPVSMVGLPGARISNMSPPTIALLTHAIWQLGLLLLIRNPLNRWLSRARVWGTVIIANGMAMSLFLWHLTALFIVTLVANLLGIRAAAAGSSLWWITRPIWLTCFAGIALLLIAAFRWADRFGGTSSNVGGRDAVGAPKSRRLTYLNTVTAGAGIWMCVIGVLGISTVGFGGIIAGHTAKLVVVPMTPLRSLGLLVAGATVLLAGPKLRPRGPRGGNGAGSRSEVAGDRGPQNRLPD